MKASATTGSSVHILLIPERHLPYGSQQASGKDSESHGSKRGELQNAHSWEQVGQRVAPGTWTTAEGKLGSETGTATGRASAGS